MITPQITPTSLVSKGLSFLLLFQMSVAAQKPTANYDEAAVGDYVLPAALRMQDGSAVESSTVWTTRRRPEVLRLFQDHVYGHTPTNWGHLQVELRDVRQDALKGTAIRKLIHLSLKERPEWSGIDVLLYLPKGVQKQVPCFVGLNFQGNHACTWESDIPISKNFIRDTEVAASRKKNTPPDPESTRGSHHSRWVPEQIIAAGYGVATAYYGDIEPDYAEGWKQSLRGALSPKGAETVWQDTDWGGIGAWAWGLSRILDCLETVEQVDAKRCAVIGHSRLGKTALWAAAQDERFSIAISNNSGEGGAALMRRNYGETVAIITKAFPHWFAGRFSTYANNEAACPTDQHLLISLIAPRPVAIGSAVDDKWADPKGEFLSGLHAGPVYELFGKHGIGTTEQPAVGQFVGDSVGYHIREGAHDITSVDWDRYLTFCKHHWTK
ncbi:MAG: acetylxylan esterase [Verrucomicrobiota bacterium]